MTFIALGVTAQLLEQPVNQAKSGGQETKAEQAPRAPEARAAAASTQKPQKADLGGGFKVRTEKGSMGMNLMVVNTSPTTFRQCKVQLNGGRYGLREYTVLDGSGRRVYPLWLFVDGNGRAPSRVKDILIHCFDPKVVATFG